MDATLRNEDTARNVDGIHVDNQVQDGTPSSSVNEVRNPDASELVTVSFGDATAVSPVKAREKAKRSTANVLTGDQMWLKSVEYKLSVVNFAKVHGEGAAAVCCQLEKSLIAEWVQAEEILLQLSASIKAESRTNSPAKKGGQNMYSDIESDSSLDASDQGKSPGKSPGKSQSPKRLPATCGSGNSDECKPAGSSHKGQHTKSYTIEFKLQAVDYAKEHSVAETARQFQVDKKQIRYWRQQEDMLRNTKNPEKGKRILTSQGRPFQYPEIDTEIASWAVGQMAHPYITLTATALKMKAKRLHAERGDPNFAASNQWVIGFIRRHNIVLSKKKKQTGAQNKNKKPRFSRPHHGHHGHQPSVDAQTYRSNSESSVGSSLHHKSETDLSTQSTYTLHDARSDHKSTPGTTHHHDKLDRLPVMPAQPSFDYKPYPPNRPISDDSYSNQMPGYHESLRITVNRTNSGSESKEILPAAYKVLDEV